MSRFIISLGIYGQGYSGQIPTIFNLGRFEITRFDIEALEILYCRKTKFLHQNIWTTPNLSALRECLHG